MTHLNPAPGRPQELLLRPAGEVEVRQEPDGEYELHWLYEGTSLSILLDYGQLRELVSKGLDADMIREPVAVPAREQ